MNETLQASSTDRRAAAIADDLEQFRRMIEIRAVEDGLNDFFSKGEIKGSIHTGQGQEAVAVAAAAVSEPGDYASATYRGHAAALAFGMTPLAVAGEVLGRSAGCVHGLGGSMHMVDAKVNVLPTTAIVGAGLPIAVGAALSAALRETRQVSIVFFGDGSTNIGAFHESLNLAAVWKLPVVFVCENNLYGEYSPIANTTAGTDLAGRAAPFGIPAQIVDGQDLTALKPVLAQAIAAARRGEGPQFVEAKTYRYSGHSRSDPATYRPAGELEEWQGRDPIDIFRRALITVGSLDDAKADRVAQETRAAVSEALQAAISSPRPAPELLWQNVGAQQ